MKSLVWALLGALVAASALDDPGGALLGAALGLLAAGLLDARKRTQKLERDQHDLLLELRAFRLSAEQRLERAEQAPGAVASVEALRGQAAASSLSVDPLPIASAVAVSAEPSFVAPIDAPEPHVASASEPTFNQPLGGQLEAPSAPAGPAYAQSDPAARRPDPFDVAFAWLRSLVLGGNTIVRVGVLILLIGVVLLLRLAAEHDLLPIELRVGAAALIALALVVVGYRQRGERPGFGQSLQGAGVAALYLVVFFAFRRYELLPAGLAFSLLVVIALSSGVLAVLQDAIALIVIGQVGGFMAPVLASSGGGSHVALFSYYLLLNLLIFAVAWFKPWRALNLIGFAFTFGIGSSWGALRYEPALFASTEPFLIAFFLLYSGIPVLYALRAAAPRRGWVDASLVFGTPLAVLLLQYALVKDAPFGMAYSALGLAAFYIGLSSLLYRYMKEALRSLIETLLAVGVGFATLSVPYGFDNHDFTGATWALEGAGLYWVGMRQRRWLSRLAGTCLQLLAAGALLYQRVDGHQADEALPIVNARFLASLFVCLGCLFVARIAYARRAQLSGFEASGLQTLIALGLAFFFAAIVHEVSVHGSDELAPGVTLASIAATLLLLEWTGERLAWLPGRYPGALFVLLLVPCLWLWEAGPSVHPLGRGGWLALPLCFALCIALLRSFARDLASAATPLHCAVLWFVATFASLEATHLVRDFAELNASWAAAALGCTLALLLVLTVQATARARWPFSAAPTSYALLGAGGIAAVLSLFTLVVSAELPGDSEPLSFLPVLNPLDLAQVFVLVALSFWLSAVPGYGAVGLKLNSLGRPGLGALAFLALNALLARSVHQLAQVPFDFDSLWESTPMQVTLSVSWSLLGLAGTAAGSARKLRWLWIAAAILLGVVVLKLFTVDLAQLSTIAKIGTFLGVGFLLVLVGYFAPVPPPPHAASSGPKDA